MGATSITIRDRENVFNQMENQLVDQGTKYLLDREFALGKGIDKKRVDFLVQYTSLLCNDNCDINSIIESKIKGLEGIDCTTKVSFQMELSRLSEQYYEWLDEGNSGNFLEYILQTANISSCVSWNQTSW